MNNITNTYDAIIIGGGISGLVCGCYLARSKMKVLLIEKNHKVGGYCSFLTKDKYKFNLTTCTLGSFRKSGILNKIFYNELDLSNILKLKRNDPSNTIVTEDGVFNFHSTGQEPFCDLIKLFPKQANKIESFFNLVLFTNPLELYAKYKNISFGEVLDSFFSSERLRNFFAITCGIFGTAPYKISAFSALIYYKETIFDGGYYVPGGAERLPEALLKVFMESEGKVLLSTKVNKIIISEDGKKVESVVLESGKKIKTNYLIACCDAKETFLNLIGEKKLDKNFSKTIKNMSVTLSAFIVYLGLKKPLLGEISAYKSKNIWFYPRYKTKENFNDIISYNKQGINRINYLLCHLSSSVNESLVDQVTLYTLAPFMDRKYWHENKDILSKKIIKKTEKLINNLSKNIQQMLIVTPIDLYDISLNFKGAIKGWASTIEQNSSKMIPQGKIFDNLYTAGQWSTLESGQGGIAMASFTARRAAKLIQRQFLMS